MSVSGKGARRKGIRFEQIICQDFRELGFKEAKRHLEMQMAEAQGYDLDNTYPFKVQCKHWAKLPPVSKIHEIKYNEGEYPLLIMKQTRGEEYGVMYWKDLKRILKLLKNENIL